MPSLNTKLYALAFAMWFGGVSAEPAHAQSSTRQRITCLTADIDEDPETVIGACTEAITGGAFGDEGQMARAYYRRASFRVLDRGDYALAITDFDRAIEIAPRFAPAFAGRGLAYQRAGDPTRALDDLNNAIRLDRDHAFAYSNRALLYLGQRDYAPAIADLDRAISLEPDDADAVYKRGVARLGAGDYANAIADFDRVLQLDANRPDPQAYRGVGTYDRAIADFEAAFADHDAAAHGAAPHAGALYGRGLARVRLGQTAEGEADIAAATAQDTDVAAKFAGYGVNP